MTDFPVEALEALDAVAWDRFESGDPEYPAGQVPRLLRRLARKGGAANETDCSALSRCLAVGSGEVVPAATAALPFVTALVADPDAGDRVVLVEMLVALAVTAARAAPALVDEGWPAAWRDQREAVRTLLADPDPGVRRAALPLVDGAGPLLERWRTETDPAVRLPLLLALGEAAAAAAGATAGPARYGIGVAEAQVRPVAAAVPSAEGAPGAVERVRGALADVLRGGSPVMKVAAVCAWAHLDPDVPLQRAGLLLEILCDTTTRPEFEALWCGRGAEYSSSREFVYSREDAVPWVTSLFDHDPEAAVRFVARLAGAAGRAGDAALCRAALGEAWRLLVLRPSAAPALLPVAGGLLGDPDDAVRLRAANLLAVLGPRAAEYADRLAALLDDPGGDDFDCIGGTVGDYAGWALVRIGDPRALPGLVDRLYAPDREDRGRGYGGGAPRLPDIHEVLVPLRAHAEVLLPSLREAMRHHAARSGGVGPLTGQFLQVLKAWGPAAVAALPEILPLLDDARSSLPAVDVLAAMGPAAASAGPALRACTVLDHPGNHHKVAWGVWRTAGGDASVLRTLGEAVLNARAPVYGPVLLLADFGPAAAPYAGRVRHVMENTEGWYRMRSAIVLWSITGEPEPSASVLEEYVLPVADGDESYGFLVEALGALARIGRISPAARTALRRVKGSDRRLSPYRDYRAFLRDEEARAAIEDVLTLP
ncbi:HEAT repeat domain-containing protein [Streptomyces sp. NBC_00435]|uniref:HEAT repeat domain-containing protein n=1 Tax=Streptomyces sp. NBC_00435 TaxID=2903649 RepID=UPI002E1F1860